MNPIKYQILGLAILCTLSQVHAQTLLEVSLDMNSLPSQQGWTFGGGLPESSVFGVDGITLHQNTIGYGYGTSTAAVYGYSTSDIMGANYWSINVSAHLEDYEFTMENSEAYSFLVVYNGYMCGFHLQPNQLRTFDGTAVPLDCTEWHDYQMVGDLFHLTYQIHIDDSHAYSGNMGPTTLPSVINFGDYTFWANSAGDIASLEFVLQTEIPITAKRKTWGSIKTLYGY